MSLYKEEYSRDNRNERVYYPVEQAQQIEELTELSLTPQTLGTKTQKDKDFAILVSQRLCVG